MIAISKEKPAKGATIIDAPVPKIGPKDILVKVEVASICGTDKHIYEWDNWAANRIKPPLIFGHEFAGVVTEVGSEVRHRKPGDHVSGETHIPCGGCYQCRTGKMHLCQNVSILGVDQNGCFAEFVALPEICSIKNDKDMSWEIASVQEPLGNAIYCLTEANVSGKSVAIIGDGPAGLFATAAAKPFGAMKVFAIGMQEFRLDIMKKYDPDEVINVKKQNPVDVIMEKTRGEGVDVIIEMSGSEKAIHDGFKMLRRAGKFIAFGLPSKPITLDLSEEIIFKGINLIAINGRKMFQTWFDIDAFIKSKRADLSSIITHSFPLNEFENAMELLTGPEIKAGKIILKP